MSTPVQRNTRQRQVILEELQKLTSHPTAVGLYEIVRRRLPKISLGTVYRNLELLGRLGMIQKLEVGGREARFDGDVQRHDHVRCVQCGRVDDIHGPPLDLLGGMADDSGGYQILGYRLQYLGLCPAVQGRARAIMSREKRRFLTTSKGDRIMLSSKLQDALNKQINAELFSSYLYLSMAAYFEAEDLKGMAHWMRMQSGEETAHAMRIFDFINDRDGRVALAADRGPQDPVEVAAGGLRGGLQARAEDHRHDQRPDEPGGRREGRRRPRFPGMVLPRAGRGRVRRRS